MFRNKILTITCKYLLFKIVPNRTTKNVTVNDKTYVRHNYNNAFHIMKVILYSFSLNEFFCMHEMACDDEPLFCVMS